jgi:hypothetical protein
MFVCVFFLFCLHHFVSALECAPAPSLNLVNPHTIHTIHTHQQSTTHNVYIVRHGTGQPLPQPQPSIDLCASLSLIASSMATTT